MDINELILSNQSFDFYPRVFCFLIITFLFFIINQYLKVIWEEFVIQISEKPDISDKPDNLKAIWI